MRKDLYDQLLEYRRESYVPMHMPGAKRNEELFVMENPYSIDITEIEGFDNLHHPTGIIKEAFQRCANLFGAKESLFLVNGSSAGILSAICGATHQGDKCLVARNAHRSVYNAIYLNQLNPVYIYPPKISDAGIYGAMNADQIEEAIQRNPDIRVVIITSPTYEGIVSDVKAIASVVHKYNKVLIVDEAHGAHFNFHKAFPESAVTCGADVVIQSIHKTLPSFTQTALLHMNGDRVDRERVKMYWDMVQTTSPSYILMAGIDRCMTILQNDGDKLFNEYVNRLVHLRDELNKLQCIHLFPVDDLSKIVLVVPDGKQLYDILLRQYHIQLEMASASYVIAMTSIGDTEEYYQRFLCALQEIDQKMVMEDQLIHPLTSMLTLQQAEVYMNIYDAMNSNHMKEVCLRDSCGYVSASQICIYPPGIPLVNPGEKITQEIINITESAVIQGLEVIGVEKSKIKVIEQKA
jgi:arginine/lysine/ornithine decarboxylase